MSDEGKAREWWIEFQGDPRDDKENYKRYVSGVEFKPISPSDEVIRVVEYSAYEALTARIAELEALLENMDEDYDPTPWCVACGAMKRRHCNCGPIAENE
jgi:hypothetical protein